MTTAITPLLLRLLLSFLLSLSPPLGVSAQVFLSPLLEINEEGRESTSITNKPDDLCGWQSSNGLMMRRRK